MEACCRKRGRRKLSMSPGNDVVIPGEAFDVHSMAHGHSFIGQETEPASLSATSLRSAATPCQSRFR